MNIFYTRLIGVLFCFVAFNLNAQSDIFNESKISLNFNSKGNYKGNITLNGQFYVFDNAKHFNQRLLELSHFSTLGLTNKHSLSLGVRYGNRDWFENKSNEFRITEQFNIKSILNQWRFGHRFRIEQRIYDTKTVHRFRYRLALDTPLNGLKLDIRELYFIASTEWLWSIANADTPQLDQRITTQLGWFYSKDLKFQLGFQYRLNGLNRNSNQTGFILTSAIISI